MNYEPSNIANRVFNYVVYGTILISIVTFIGYGYDADIAFIIPVILIGLLTGTLLATVVSTIVFTYLNKQEQRKALFLLKLSS